MQPMHTARIKASAFFTAVICVSTLLLSFMLSPLAAEGASLTIGNGVIIQADSTGQLVIRDTLKASKSTLTSGKTTPAPGDWLGLLVLGSATGTEFIGTVIEFAGSGGGALDIRGASPTVSGVEIKQCSGSGIKLSRGATPTINDAIITGNNVGIETSDGANPSVQNSFLAGNNIALQNLDQTRIIIATGNWWGHPSGPLNATANPAGLGNPVSDWVTYTPWSTVVPLLGTSFSIAQGSMTESPAITLNLSCKTCTEFIASESPAFSAVTYQPFIPQAPFTLSPGDAAKTVYVRFRASTGNTGVVTSANIRLDTAGPALTVSNPAAGSIVSRPTSIDAAATDPAGVTKVEFYIDNLLASTDLTNSYSFSWDVLSATDGGHELKTIAYDTLGHTTTDTRTVTVSKAPPTAPVITSPASVSMTTKSVTVTGTSEPNISVSLYINGVFTRQTNANMAGVFQYLGVTLIEGANNLTVAASDSLGSSPKSATVLVMVDTGPPGVPGIYSYVAAPGGGIKLSWTPDMGEVPAHYNLYRALTPFTTTAGATLVSNTITTTSYTDLPPVDGLYYYRLTAFDAAGNESALSPIVTVASDRTPPSAMVAFSPLPPFGPNSGAVTITLTLSEALAMPPYLGIAPAGDLPGVVPLAQSSETVWTGSYAVTAATPNGTATVLFAGKDLTGNKGAQITVGSSFTIDTKGPSGSLQFNPPVAVFKPGNVALTLTLDEPVPLTPNLQFTPPSGPAAPVTLTGSGTTWSGTLTITAPMADGSGRFSMTTNDSFGNNGSSLGAGSSITLDVTPPVAPTALAAVAAAGGTVRLTWNTLADAASYRVYRATSTITTINGLSPLKTVIAATTTDTPATDDSYHYVVTALDAAGNESPLSNDVVAVSDRVPPGVPGVGLIQILANKAVQLSWNAPTGEAAASYRLYRATTPILSLSGLTPLKIVSAPTATTTDTPATDATYFYAVTALDAAGNESIQSSYPELLYNLSPPVITVTGVNNQQYSAGPVTPTITVTSASSTTQSALMDGVMFTSGTVIGVEGSHLLHIEATDASSRTMIKEITFTIDLIDPVVTLANVVEGTLYETAVTPLITVSDLNLDRTIITLNGAAYLSGTPITTDGAKTLRVEALDLAGRSKIVAVNFSVDAAPPPPATLSVTATQGGSAVLTWGASAAGDLAGYLVYKNGVKLTTAPQMSLAYTDASFSGDTLQRYSVSAVDAAGHEGVALVADVLPVQVVLKNYGRANGSGFILSKQFIESIKVDLVNGSSSSVSVGPITYELLDHLGMVAESIQSAPTVLAAGATVNSEKILPLGNGIVDYRIYTVTLTLPAGPNVSVKRVASFNLAAFDPGRKIEIFNEPIVKGATARVRLKIFNHGSAPIELLTSSGHQPSADIYILLKDQDGNVLVKGNLNQEGSGVINYGGNYALAEIPPGGSFLTAPLEIIVPSTAPDTLYLYAYVKNIYYHYNKPEQLTAGDFSSYTTIVAGLPPYTATITSDRLVYDQRLSTEQTTPTIILSGNAFSTVDGITPAPNVPVRIGIGVKGFARYLLTTTDNTGYYSTTFVPLVGEAGNYSLWATHPSVADKPIQAGFTIYGLGFDPRAVNLRMSKNSSFSMPLTLKNLGEADLTGLQFSLTSADGISGSIDLTGSATALAGGKATTVKMTLNAALTAPDASSATVTVTTSAGITRTLDVNIALLTALPTISTDPAFIEVGVNRNSSKVATFKLKNVGYAPLENIVIESPALPWIGLLSANTLPNLAPGTSTDISVNFRPTDAVAQGPHADKLVISSGNHVPYTLNLFATVISSNKGSVHLLVTDSLAKKVVGASVVISHQQLGSVYLTGTVDANGEVSFLDIVEGMYNYKVQAPGHEVVIGTFEIVPGAVTPLEVFMNNVFVTFDWSVVPMTLTDKYDVKLTATFETQVPAPVLTIDPAYEKLELEIGSTYVGEYRVTNHGLVALDDVKINLAGAPGLRVEALVTELPRIGAMETVIIPYRITVNPFKSPEPVDACSKLPMTVNVGGTYTCAAGVPTWGGVTGTKTIIPKDTYDPLGLCDVGCDWCKCLPGPAQGICNCIKTRDPCTCLGLVGGGGAEIACGCISTADPLSCMANAALNAATDAIRDKIIELTPGIGQAKAALDLAKNIASCLLCVLELLPGLPSSPASTATGGFGGGTYGGMGSVLGGGNGFSSVRTCL